MNLHLVSRWAVILLIGCAGSSVLVAAQGVPQKEALEYRTIAAERGPTPVRLAILLPPGGGDRAMADAVVSYLGTGLAKAGWTVVVPYLPGKLAGNIGGHPDRVLATLAAVQAKPGMGTGPVPLLGVSNGGNAAVAIAASNPGRFSRLVLHPGVPGQNLGKGLEGLPVWLRIGKNDELGWAQAFPMAESGLLKAKAKLDAKLIPGGHSPPVDWNALLTFLGDPRVKTPAPVSAKP